MGSVSSTPSYLKVVGLNDGSQHTQLLIGTINAIYWIGVMIGALLVGWFSDRVGRRRAIVFAGMFGLLVVPLFSSLQNFTWALILRFLNGFFTGAFDSVGLNWAAESVNARYRGFAIGSQLCCAATGASISYFMVYGLSKVTTTEILWRLPIAFQLVYAVLVLSSVYFLPESPRWLVQVGLFEEARDVLLKLRGSGLEEGMDGAVKLELETMAKAIEKEVEANSSSTYWSMLTKRDQVHTARRTWSAFLVQFGVQALIGVGVVSGYGGKIFETGGFSTETSALLAGVGIVTQAIFGIPGAMFSDKIGRRRAMVYGAFISSIVLALIGVCGHFVNKYAGTNPALAKRFGLATIALVELWSAVFGLTWCKFRKLIHKVYTDLNSIVWCPFVYPSEIFPAQSRAKGSSIGIVGLASGSFLINMISPYLFAAIGYKAMFLFCGTGLWLASMCYLWLPETARKSLEEVDRLFD